MYGPRVLLSILNNIAGEIAVGLGLGGVRLIFQQAAWPRLRSWVREYFGAMEDER
jgi:hypothetical protein